MKPAVVVLVVVGMVVMVAVVVASVQKVDVDYFHVVYDLQLIHSI